MLSAFVSYSHQDADTAELVAARLEAAGIKVWWDRRLGSGASMHSQIDEHLQAADKVLVLWSGASVKSDWVVAEAEYAAKSSKLVSLKIAPCEPPVRFQIYNYIETNDIAGDFPIVLQAMLNVSRTRALQPKEKQKDGAKREFFIGLVVGRYRLGLVIGAVVSLLAMLVALPRTAFFKASPTDVAGHEQQIGNSGSRTGDNGMRQVAAKAPVEPDEKNSAAARNAPREPGIRTANERLIEEAERRRQVEAIREERRLQAEREKQRSVQHAAGKDPSGQEPLSQNVTFPSPEAAYEIGLAAWRGGFTEHAVPALRYAADRDVLPAQFYLARIYADNGTVWSNHAAAYQLYRKITLDHANIAADDDQRGPFVARSLVAVAGYTSAGLPEAGLAPDPARAFEYLRHAAQLFNDEEAQFQLAKAYLAGTGVLADTQAGLHWLSTVSQRGHAGAQAFLADVYWRGRHNQVRDPARAFALISVAVENAAESERLWIEEMYQNIYCGASADTQQRARSIVSDLRRRYERRASAVERTTPSGLPPPAVRVCSDGRAVPLPIQRAYDTPRGAVAKRALGVGVDHSPSRVHGSPGAGQAISNTLPPL